MATDMAHELKILKTGITAVSLWPGAVATEIVLDTKFFPREMLESTEYTGRCICALLKDPNSIRHSGKTMCVGDLAKEYNFTDIDGKSPGPAIAAAEMDRLIGVNRGLPMKPSHTGKPRAKDGDGRLLQPSKTSAVGAAEKVSYTSRSPFIHPLVCVLLHLIVYPRRHSSHRTTRFSSRPFTAQTVVWGEVPSRHMTIIKEEVEAAMADPMSSRRTKVMKSKMMGVGTVRILIQC
jgi:hypothetical protein